MNRFSLNLGTYAGIPVKLHWSFWFIFIWVVYVGWKEGLGWINTVLYMAFTLCLFLCVLLHEYGHALMAHRFGIITQDIILSPIGGIARMKEMPEDPKEEILVAFAGPAVNVLICIILGIVIWLADWTFFPRIEALDFTSLELFTVLTFWLNFVLFLFNLLPAFPMDGGRVVRALLCYKWNRVKATRIASYIGQAIAVGFILLGIWNNQFVLPFIGLFIIITARNELAGVKQKFLYTNTTAADVMNHYFFTAYHDDLVEDVLHGIVETGNTSIVIKGYNGELLGTLTKEELEASLRNRVSLNSPISHIMSYVYEPLYAHQSLKEVVKTFNTYHNNSFPVLSGEILVGTINRDYLKAWISEQ